MSLQDAMYHEEMMGRSKRTEKWTEEWPSEPGWYWMWGKRFPKSEKPELRPVQFIRSTCGLLAIDGGSFLYQQDAGEVVWQPIVMPGLPGAA
jgi:hypothetical protein